MKINETIARLQRLAPRYGDNVDVFFDCPKCGLSFIPNAVAAVAVHLGVEDQEPKGTEDENPYLLAGDELARTEAARKGIR